jgi:predicted peptidase
MGTFTAAAQDLSAFEKKEFVSADGKKLLYRILYPQDYVKTKKYPLVLVLHGSGERGSDNEKQLTHGGKLFLDPAIRKNFPSIVVFPQCPENDYWASVKIERDKTPLQLDFDYTRPLTTPLALTIGLTDSLLASGSIDDRRVYITGLSMGGMGTFEAVHHYPDLFAAALPICGGGDTVRYNKLKAPFWIFHGEIDGVVNADYSRAMVAKLRKENMKVKYSEYPGVNHNSWENAFAEPEFFRWMFSQKSTRKPNK